MSTGGDRDAALLVSTWVPQPSGQGTPMRVWQLLRLLVRRYRRTRLLLVVDPAACAAGIAALQRALPQLELQLIEGRLPSTEQRRQSAQAVMAEPWSRVLVFRSEAAFLLSALQPAAHWWLDLDECASHRERNLGALAERHGHRLGVEHHRRTASINSLLERGLNARYARLLVSSQEEAGRLAGDQGLKGHVLPNIYPELPVAAPPVMAAPLRLLFVGFLGYAPNDDAVRWLADELAPAIRAQLAEGYEFLIAGAGASQALAGRMADSGLRHLGFVPDLAPVYRDADADAVLVPLRYGSGTRIKILEAFAHGRPVVSTRQGMEGIAAVPDRDFLIADDACGFASASVRLQREVGLAARLAESARHFLAAHHSEAALESAWDTAEAGG